MGIIELKYDRLFVYSCRKNYEMKNNNNNNNNNE